MYCDSCVSSLGLSRSDDDATNEMENAKRTAIDTLGLNAIARRKTRILEERRTDGYRYRSFYESTFYAVIGQYSKRSAVILHSGSEFYLWLPTVMRYEYLTFVIQHAGPQSD